MDTLKSLLVNTSQHGELVYHGVRLPLLLFCVIPLYGICRLGEGLKGLLLRSFHFQSSEILLQITYLQIDCFPFILFGIWGFTSFNTLKKRCGHDHFIHYVPSASPTLFCLCGYQLETLGFALSPLGLLYFLLFSTFCLSVLSCRYFSPVFCSKSPVLTSDMSKLPFIYSLNFKIR